MASNGLKPLKKKASAASRAKQCRHNWTYEHIIYGLGRGDDNEGLAMHRQCRECGVHEICKVHKPTWTRNVKGFDLPDLGK